MVLHQPISSECAIIIFFWMCFWLQSFFTAGTEWHRRLINIQWIYFNLCFLIVPLQIELSVVFSSFADTWHMNTTHHQLYWWPTQSRSKHVLAHHPTGRNQGSGRRYTESKPQTSVVFTHPEIEDKKLRKYTYCGPNTLKNSNDCSC